MDCNPRRHLYAGTLQVQTTPVDAAWRRTCQSPSKPCVCVLVFFNQHSNIFFLFLLKKVSILICHLFPADSSAASWIGSWYVFFLLMLTHCHIVMTQQDTRIIISMIIYVTGNTCCDKDLLLIVNVWVMWCTRRPRPDKGQYSTTGLNTSCFGCDFTRSLRCMNLNSHTHTHTLACRAVPSGWVTPWTHALTFLAACTLPDGSAVSRKRHFSSWRGHLS